MYTCICEAREIETSDMCIHSVSKCPFSTASCNTILIEATATAYIVHVHLLRLHDFVLQYAERADIVVQSPSL